jgi:hypothetical protein
MPELRISKVTIAMSRPATTVEIPWASRQALLDRLRREGGADELIRQFENAGASRPVKPRTEGKRRLLDTVTRWLYETASTAYPPASSRSGTRSRTNAPTASSTSRR